MSSDEDTTRSFRGTSTVRRQTDAGTTGSSTSNGVVAGVVLAGAGIAGAIVLHFLKQTKKPAAPSRRPAAVKDSKRTIVQRRAGTASNASSAQAR